MMSACQLLISIVCTIVRGSLVFGRRRGLFLARLKGSMFPIWVAGRSNFMLQVLMVLTLISDRLLTLLLLLNENKSLA